MGVVDLAVGPGGTQVALKRLTLHGSAGDIRRARQRIEREAEVLSRLDHPNIVGLLEVLDEGDELTLVMPYLTGGTLAERVARHGPAPAAEVLRLADDLSAALAAAHRAGVVHRDLKPANVLFDADGIPHLADFGVASSREHTAGVTAIGTVVGTAGFMAPEQARGEAAGQAADVFSLGATLLHAATGEGPYGKGAPELLMVRAAQGKVRPVPRHLPVELRRRLQSMLDPRPERRPSAAALAGGPAGTSVRAGARRARRRWPPGALAVAAGAFAVLAGAAVATRETGDPPPSAAAPSTTACTPLRYQPCGQPGPAANTDGETCLADFEDYDRVPSNGCEAAPDPHPDGTPLVDAIDATIVPRGDVDRFELAVGDRLQVLCDGRLVVTLTAPPGLSLRLEVLEGDAVLGTTTSADGVPASLRIEDPRCLFDDATTIIARVSAIGSDRSAAPYLLERSGGF